MIKIGHAASDERGKYSGGAAGDQTGREICIREWYNRPWDVMVRPKSTYCLLYTSMDNEANKTVVDSILSDESENPVQNKVVKAELDKKLSNTDKGVAGGIAELDPSGKRCV